MYWTNIPDIKLSDILHERRSNEVSVAESVFISPEVHRFRNGEELDIDWKKVDVYALGIIFLQVLCLDDLKNSQIDQEKINWLISN